MPTDDWEAIADDLFRQAMEPDKHAKPPRSVWTRIAMEVEVSSPTSRWRRLAYWLQSLDSAHVFLGHQPYWSGPFGELRPGISLGLILPATLGL